MAQERSEIIERIYTFPDRLDKSSLIESVYTFPNILEKSELVETTYTFPNRLDRSALVENIFTFPNRLDRSGLSEVVYNFPYLGNRSALVENVYTFSDLRDRSELTETMYTFPDLRERSELTEVIYTFPNLMEKSTFARETYIFPQKIITYDKVNIFGQEIDKYKLYGISISKRDVEKTENWVGINKEVVKQYIEYEYECRLQYLAEDEKDNIVSYIKSNSDIKSNIDRELFYEFEGGETVLIDTKTYVKVYFSYSDLKIEPKLKRYFNLTIPFKSRELFSI